MQFILQEVRKNKDITQKQLSEETKLSISYIQKLETGNRKKPSYEVARKLATALGVKTEELFISNGN